VPEAQLNLLQRSFAFMRQLRKRATKIMGSKLWDTNRGTSALDNFENAARRHAPADNAPGFVHAAEDSAGLNLGPGHPGINRLFGPARHRHAADPFTREIAAACSGAMKPLSAASTASLRIAESRWLMVEEERRRASRFAR
jgi:hypothetical protein